MSGIEPLTCRLQEVCSQAAHALAAPMTQAIALKALAALGLFCASSHEPFHANGGQASMAATERGGQRPPQRRPRFAMVRKDSRLGRCTAESGRTWIKAARCARRGSAPALGLCLGRPGRARADSLPQLTALIALIRHGRECCSPGRRPQVLARGAGYPSGGIVGRAALAVSRPLPSLRPDSQASMAAGGPVTSTGGLVPMCSMP